MTVEELIAQDIGDVNERMTAVEEFYINARLTDVRLTPAEIDAINSYVLREDLRYNHADKMTLIEYPVMSDRQIERRTKKEASLRAVHDVGTDGRRHNKPLRKKRSNYETWHVDHHARSKNTTRKRKYNEFVAVQPVLTYYLGKDEIDEYLREKYGRKIK